MKSLFFLILLRLLLLLESAMGDRRLIESTCRATPSYTLCTSTLLSNPKSLTGDTSDLGLIMVGATRAKAARAIKQINSLYGSHPELRRWLNGCGRMYRAVVRGDVVSAVAALNGGQPKFAEDGMADAAVEAQACERSFGRRSPLTETNKAVEDVANVARAIIRMLL